MRRIKNRQGLTRRGLFGATSAVAAAAAMEATGITAQSAVAAPLNLSAKLYESIGVKPVVNCRGTFTIITGSQSLPEVKQAMELASHHYVHMDELMDAVGQRLAELTKAEWGIVTNGCAAALAHATAACITGGDPEKMQRMPDLTGMKNEVIVPRYARNVYDHAVRMTGVKMIEVDTAAQFEAAVNERTAMVMIMSSPAAEKGELSIKNTAVLARKHGIPLLIDAAAEELKIPNIHLENGAHMVAYSGGKCLRGPQAGGMLLGQKDLLKTAWVCSAPHHAFGRSMKVGKEEVMGMLTAVEMWVKRDHDAEWKNWESRNEYIATAAMKVPGVTKSIHQPEDLSNHAPVLQLSWDATKLGITGNEVEELLLNGTPRIVVAGSSGSRRELALGGTPRPSTIRVMPYMMQPGDEKIAAEAIHRILANPPKFTTPTIAPADADISGTWNVDLKFLSGAAKHHLTIQQAGAKLAGNHQGETIGGTLNGSVEGKQVSFRSNHKIQGTSLSYNFTGTVDGNTMRGTVSLAEYGKADFVATRA
ncbi:MAG TPA: PLP-dependent transferase [Bryobacteraceae bacterium]|nr:PLP-dependent transferase [Bryobacteraceae bacterium]